MSTTNTTTGGWENSYMRNTICPAFLAAMPVDWQKIIVSCTKYSDNKGNGSDTAANVSATMDKIFLLSEWEVFGYKNGANSYEQNYQEQYGFYKNGNSKVKYKHNATSYLCDWWLRSVNAIYTNSFRSVIANGSSYSNYSYTSYGFAPGFKVA